MTIVQNRIAAIRTSGVRLLAHLRRFGHQVHRTEAAGPIGAFVDKARLISADKARLIGCVDPGPSGFDFSEDEARRVLRLPPH